MLADVSIQRWPFKELSLVYTSPSANLHPDVLMAMFFSFIAPLFLALRSPPSCGEILKSCPQQQKKKIDIEEVENAV